MFKFKSIFKCFIITFLIVASLSAIKATDVYAFEDGDPYRKNVVNPTYNL